MENEFIEGNTWAAEQICQDPLNLTFLTGVMVEHNKKENFSVSRPNTERCNGSAFFYYCYCKQVQTKTPLWTLLDVPLCFLPTSIFSISYPHCKDLASIFQKLIFHSAGWVDSIYYCACSVLSLCYVLYLVCRTTEVFDYLPRRS